MRQGPHSKRGRNRGGNRRPNTPNRNQTFDSNGPDVRIRGNAFQVHEKYLSLARDASASGDRILAESYFQHAEHYYRIIATFQDEQAERNRLNGNGQHHSGGAGQSGDEDDERSSQSDASPRRQHDGGEDDESNDRGRGRQDDSRQNDTRQNETRPGDDQNDNTPESGGRRERRPHGGDRRDRRPPRRNDDDMPDDSGVQAILRKGAPSQEASDGDQERPAERTVAVSENRGEDDGAEAPAPRRPRRRTPRAAQGDSSGDGGSTAARESQGEIPLEAGSSSDD